MTEAAFDFVERAGDGSRAVCSDLSPEVLLVWREDFDLLLLCECVE